MEEEEEEEYEVVEEVVYVEEDESSSSDVEVIYEFIEDDDGEGEKENRERNDLEGEEMWGEFLECLEEGKPNLKNLNISVCLSALSFSLHLPFAVVSSLYIKKQYIAVQSPFIYKAGQSLLQEQKEQEERQELQEQEQLQEQKTRHQDNNKITNNNKQQNNEQQQNNNPMYLLGCLSSSQFGYYTLSENAYSRVTKPLTPSASLFSPSEKNLKKSWREQIESQEKEQKVREEKMNQKKNERVLEILLEKGSKPIPSKNWRR